MKKGKGASGSQVNLFRKHKLETDEELVFDNSAYEMFHRCNAEWPCLSFDILLNERRDYASAFSNLKDEAVDSPSYPFSTYLVAGSQADKAKDNKLYVMKWANLCKTKHDDDDDDD